MTLCGFWVVAGIYPARPGGRPFTTSRRIGKSLRMAAASNGCDDRFRVAGSGRTSVGPRTGTGPGGEGGYEKKRLAFLQEGKGGQRGNQPRQGRLEPSAWGGRRTAAGRPVERARQTPSGDRRPRRRSESPAPPEDSRCSAQTAAESGPRPGLEPSSRVPGRAPKSSAAMRASATGSGRLGGQPGDLHPSSFVLMVVTHVHVFEQGDGVVGQHGQSNSNSEIRYEARALLSIPMKRTDSPGLCSPGSPDWNSPMHPCFRSPTRNSRIFDL